MNVDVPHSPDFSRGEVQRESDNERKSLRILSDLRSTGYAA